MSRLQAEKLSVTSASGTERTRPIIPRAYTLTHSDLTGNLFLTIGPRPDIRQISGSYDCLMRDEVLADWREAQEGFGLHVDCHVSGGLTLGSPRARLAVFRREMPLVLEALCYGGREFFDAHPSLWQAPTSVHFHARQHRHNMVENWGTPVEYRREV